MSYRASSHLKFAFGFGLVLGSALCASTPAFAGFQWISPNDQSPASSPSVITSAPVSPMVLPSAPSAQRNPEVISPIVIEGRETLPSAPLAPVSALPVVSPAPALVPAASEEAVIAPSNLPLLAPPSETLAPPSSTVQPAVAAEAKPAEKATRSVSGFADKIPLAVALRQVLPADVGFSVDRDVMLSTVVSWRGGKPWRDVLHDMLIAVGYDFRDQGQMVRIVRAAGQTNVAGTLSAPASAMAAADAVPVESAPVVMPKPNNNHVLQASAPVPAPVLIDGNKPAHTLQLPPNMRSATQAEPLVVSSAPAPSSSFAVSEVWTANRGDMLRKVLENWARRANVEINWMAEYDYPLQASLNLTGSFEEAVRNLLAGFQEAQPQPVATLHKSTTAGQTVLIVEARGNNYSD